MVTSDGVTVRRAEADDAPGFHACLDSVARERRWLAMVEAPPLAQVRAFVESGRKHGLIQFVALEAARVVGWCDISPNPLEGFHHGGTLGMGLLAGFRGRGHRHPPARFRIPNRHRPARRPVLCFRICSQGHGCHQGDRIGGTGQRRGSRLDGLRRRRVPHWGVGWRVDRACAPGRSSPGPCWPWRCLPPGPGHGRTTAHCAGPAPVRYRPGAADSSRARWERQQLA